MNKVYFIVNYNYNLVNSDYYEDDLDVFESYDVQYPILSSGVFQTLGDALAEAMRLGLQEKDAIGDERAVIKTDTDHEIPTVTVFFDEETTDTDEIAISVYAIHELEVH